MNAKSQTPQHIRTMKTTVQLITLSILISTFTLLPSAFGQGTAITYQGRLTDGAANANGAYDFTFQLFDAASGGTSQSATLTTNGVSLSDGLFTVALDFGAAPFSAGAARWLEIKVRTNGAATFGTIIPRQQVTATPYAIVAGAVTGPVSSTSLTGNYSNAVNFANGANSFSGSFAGDGAGITNLNPALLNSLVNSNSWQLDGNAGTFPGFQFLGTTDNRPLEFKVNGTRALRLETLTNGTPSLSGGSLFNSIAAGLSGATIGGGGYSNRYVFFGVPFTNFEPNTVRSDFGTISGGLGNLIESQSEDATVGGGQQILIQSQAGDSTIAGGNANQIQTGAYESTIAGGSVNQILTNAHDSAIGGGSQNVVSGLFGTVPGGANNEAGQQAFAAGSSAKAVHTGTFVWADSTGSSFTSTSSNQFLIRAAGGVGINTAKPVADLQVNGNVVINVPAQVPVSTSSSNLLNLLVGGGTAAVATNGSLNGISFYENPAAVAMSLGYDGSGGASANALRIYKSDGSPLFTFEASGELGIGTNAPQQKLHVIGNILASGTITGSSDRNVKERFAPVNPREVLEKVSSLPITEWSYKADAGVRHLGPMAQDFYSAFVVGMDDKHISMVDADGVALAAIQGLNEKVEVRSRKLEDRLQQKETEITELKTRLEKLERLLASANTKEN
jgi:hypothetical protein